MELHAQRSAITVAIARVGGRERRGGREGRGEGSGSKRISKQNPELVYIFGGLASEQKLLDTDTSRNKADGSQQ
jgi:hypothetical protein